jgi:hypothetical protein
MIRKEERDKERMRKEEFGGENSKEKAVEAIYRHSGVMCVCCACVTLTARREARERFEAV